MSRNLHHYFFKPSLPTENKSSIDINDCNSIDDDENNVVPFIPDLNQTLRQNESSDDDDEESIIIDLEANRHNWKDWLEYDEDSYAAFCFACRIYLPKTGTNYRRDAFSTTGYRNWKKSTER